MRETPRPPLGDAKPSVRGWAGSGNSRPAPRAKEHNRGNDPELVRQGATAGTMPTGRTILSREQPSVIPDENEIAQALKTR
jgi:hypothetical protein